MLKKEKIWLSIFSAMFLLPEILWSPIGNFVYSLVMPTVHGSSQILRNNFLFNSSSDSLYIIILLVQLIGIIFFTINWFRSKEDFKSKSTYWLILILGTLLSLVTLFVVYLAYAISNISF